MKVLVTPWNGSIEGCGSGDGLPLWDQALAEALPSALRAGGMEQVDEVPGGNRCLVVPAGSAVLPQALKHLEKVAVDQDVDLRFRWGGRIGALLDALPGELEPFGVLAAGGGGDDAVARLLAAPELRVEPDERDLGVTIGPKAAELALTDHVLLPVRHWTHLLWGALLGIGPVLWRSAITDRPLEGTCRLAWTALRSWSLDPAHLAPALNVKGAGVHVHPSAVVEACLLGDGARVGAGAVVRGAILGPGAVVEEQALCEGSVLGEKAVVQRQAMVRFSVLGEGAMLGGATQLSVLGPGSQMKRGAYGMDEVFEGEVRVPLGGGFSTVPLGMAGVCLGRDARVGSGVWIAPGRVVPEGARLVSSRVVSNPDQEES